MDNQQNIESYMRHLGRQARDAARQMARADSNIKNQTLRHIAAGIRDQTPAILAANQRDLDAAQASGLEPAMIDRLAMSEKSVQQMAAGVEQIAGLPDPVGEIQNLRYRPSGIQVGRMRVPLGVGIFPPALPARPLQRPPPEMRHVPPVGAGGVNAALLVIDTTDTEVASLKNAKIT